ncbi:MAG: methyltransferase domain-containing protein [Acidobacteria bacterium]|nr:methyltransferase domain-containing protein [Acidobacteriota bacterium]
MIETTDSEIDIEQLMSEIREAVALREAEGRGSLIGASLELSDIFSTIDEAVDEEIKQYEHGKQATQYEYGKQATQHEYGKQATQYEYGKQAIQYEYGKQAERPPLRLQLEFVPNEDDHYHVSDLLQYHDHTFIWNAYRAILKREPDETGLTQFLQMLRSGRFNKIDILATLRFSPEGKARNVQIDGLARRPLLRRLYRVPVFGYLLEMIVAVARLPVMIRSQRQFESHTLAQQEVLASRLNQLSDTIFQVSGTVFQVMDSFSRELAQGLSEASQGTSEVSQGLSEISQGLSEVSQEVLEISQGLSEVSQAISEVSQGLSEVSRGSLSVSRQASKVSEEQRKFAELQHQQVAGLFREQQETVERLKKLKEELKARLASPQTMAGNNLILPQQMADGKTSADEARARLDNLFALFADEFRGQREVVKEGFRFYLPLLKAAGIKNDILDIGCGRGEWLELLKEEGFDGRGVEINRVLAEQSRSRGLEVMEEDARAYLRGLPDESLNAVTGFHFIEHLSFETLIEVLDEIARTLRPDGFVIFETPNPKNLVVGACNFYSDPTHLKPLFPETVRFILGNQGFTDVQIEYVNPVGGSPFKDESESSRALDSWFFSPRDFAVIGRRA